MEHANLVVNNKFWLGLAKPCVLVIEKNTASPEQAEQTHKNGKNRHPYYLIHENRKIFLTQRQADCIRLASEHTLDEIGKQLGLSPRTIEGYLSTLRGKFNCKYKRELGRLADKIQIVGK